jgi:hypothetical protein
MGPRHDLKLNMEFGGRPRRCCYVSGGKGECYQISIEPPAGGITVVNAWDVETRDDTEFHRAWQASVGDLGSTLEDALEQIARWAQRGLPS